MTRLTDLTITECQFKSLPKDEEISLVMHANILRYASDFKINCIFKKGQNKDVEYYIALMPLKALFAFPLGVIFKDQHLINVNKISRFYDITVQIPAIQKHIMKKASEIPSLRALKTNIPNKINGYSYQHKNMLEQNFSVLIDTITSKQIIFPHYEICRRFYFRSSSLTRQVLTGNLEGLYKEAVYTDKEKRHGKLVLKFGANNADADDIFRFSKDEYANIMFKNILVDLTVSYLEHSNMAISISAIINLLRS